MEAAGASARTQNSYLRAVKSFTRWAVFDGRLHADPLAHLRAIRETDDRRRVRRALTVVEVDLALEGEPAIRVRAETAKDRRLSSSPLRAETVVRLRGLLAAIDDPGGSEPVSARDHG